MIDSLTIRWYGQVPLDRVFEHGELERETIDSKSGETRFLGHLSNLRITASTQYVAIDGSLPKFRFGNNVQDFSFQDFEKSIFKISELIGVPLVEGIVSKMETGVNVALPQPVGQYYAFLGSYPRLNRNTFGDTGLQYQCTIRSVTFYDKVEESLKRKIKINRAFFNDWQHDPLSALDGLNILRFEVRFLKQVKFQLGFSGEHLRVQSLLQPGLYGMLGSRLIQEFDRIKPIEGTVVPFNVHPNPKDTKKHLMAIGLDQVGGARRFLTLVQEAQRKREVSNVQAQRHRAIIGELGSIAPSSEVNLYPELRNTLVSSIRNFLEK